MEAKPEEKSRRVIIVANVCYVTLLVFIYKNFVLNTHSSHLKEGLLL